MGAVTGSGSNVRGEYFKSEFMWIGALVAMEYVAKCMGLERGVAFVLVKPKRDPGGDVKFKIVNNVMVRTPFGREVEAIDAGTNYFGVAMGKLAYMMYSSENSGSNKQLHKGEMPYRGGLVRTEGDYQVYVGFSGGTEDQDVEIARTGMLMLFPK